MIVSGVNLAKQTIATFSDVGIAKNIGTIHSVSLAPAQLISISAPELFFQKINPPAQNRILHAKV